MYVVILSYHSGINGRFFVADSETAGYEAAGRKAVASIFEATGERTMVVGVKHVGDKLPVEAELVID